MARSYLLRLLSSDDHDSTADELIELIQKHGTDRYDADKKQMFDDFYAKHDVDFFAEKTDESNFEEALARMVKDFPRKALGDRAREVHPDIAIVYDAGKCKMIESVYDGQEASDCYRFISSPVDALVEVRKL